MSQSGPEKTALDAMATGDPDEPVWMLNLLRYREQAASGFGVDGLSGEAAYRVYGKKFAQLNPRFGGQPIWMGEAQHTLIGDESWDVIIVVHYPTRKQFVEMINDPDYQAIAPIRAAALADSRLIESSQLLPKLEP
jgi:uncharacterized protein (DUF1330 family)